MVCSEKRGIIKDFKGPLNKMVKAGDNFVTAIYSNKVSISAFPGISPAFYSTLQKVRLYFFCRIAGGGCWTQAA